MICTNIELLLQNDQVGLQRMEMLKVRAALEDKLKQKGVFSVLTPKPDIAQKHLQPLNRYPFWCKIKSTISLFPIWGS